MIGLTEMRADRLLSVVLLLQTRGRMTATNLAKELGVSKRTILRDIDALSLAGIPIYALGGHGGGVALDENYRTTLTGLRSAEVKTLFIPSNNTVLQDLGLEDAGESLLLKLLAALPTAHRPTIDHIRQRILIDPSWWWHDKQTMPFWDSLLTAVYEDRLIGVTYEHYDGGRVERTLEPYSLVNKASNWYLIARRDQEMRTYRVTRFHDVQLLDARFSRASDFDLPTYWQDNLHTFTEAFSEYQCKLRVHPERAAAIRWLFAGRWKIVDEADERGWVTFLLSMEAPLLARMLVSGLGTDVEVLSPKHLQEEVTAGAREWLALYDE